MLNPIRSKISQISRVIRVMGCSAPGVNGRPRERDVDPLLALFHTRLEAFAMIFDGGFELLFGDIGLFSGFRALLRRQAGDIA
jgi:hypothetical protein